MSTVHGGGRSGAGRPPEPSGRELKQQVSVRVYPSKLAILRHHGVSLQSLLDDAVERELKKPSRRVEVVS